MPGAKYLLALCVATAPLTFCGASQAATITMIAPPDATQSFASGINDNGDIAGSFNINLQSQSFVRAADGTYTTFTPSLASGLNNKGWVIGDVPPGQGFIRKPKGRILTFGDANAYHNFVAAGINAQRTVCGSLIDAQGTQHAFVRTADGTFTVFDPPGSTSTFATDINDSGLVVGAYDSGMRSHGFIRGADGAITTFDDPDAHDIVPFSINRSGVIVGEIGEYGSVVVFIRSAAGKFKRFDLPGSDVDQLDWVGINDNGMIAGSYDHDSGETASGFIRARDGTVTTFDLPDAYFTYVTGINRQGAVVGFIDGTDGYYHGYLRTP